MVAGQPEPDPQKRKKEKNRKVYISVKLIYDL
jgi:hypothetical protein